jgi:hypothetical protein
MPTKAAKQEGFCDPDPSNEIRNGLFCRLLKMHRWMTKAPRSLNFAHIYNKATKPESKKRKLESE